jgi:hypothetical protein
MNSFRLVLCLAGLLAYVVTKHFTAPDEHSVLPASATHLMGVGLELPDPQAQPAALALVGTSSNAEPAFLRKGLPQTKEAQKTPVEADHATVRADLGALPVLGRN